MEVLGEVARRVRGGPGVAACPPDERPTVESLSGEEIESDREYDHDGNQTRKRTFFSFARCG